jgi:glycosyltransferase involved in cell wall biosynthesis
VNVLCVIHYPVFGGPHNKVMQLMQPLADRGVRLTVVVPEGGNAEKRLRAGGVEPVTLALHRARATRKPGPHIALLRGFVPEVLALRDIIRTYDIDVVSLAGLVNPHAAIAARLERRAIVWQLLDTRAPMSVRRAMMPLVTRLADVIMSTGRGVARVHPGAENFDGRLYAFYPPVDFERFKPGVLGREATREGFGFGPDDLVLVSVGNLNPQKGYEYLLRAVSFVRREGHAAKALIVGASHETHVAYEGMLYRLCGELDLELGRDVIFAGALQDVREALAAADIFVLSSVPRSEGVPTAVEEAMGMGLPVVSTDVGAIAELVRDGVSGMLVRPLDADALGGAIVRLAEPALRAQVATTGRERALSMCSREQCTQTHIEAFETAWRHAAMRLGHRSSHGPEQEAMSSQGGMQ